MQSQRALNVALQQTAVKDRERRILQLTIDEISQMQGEVSLYKGVGKMYVYVLFNMDDPISTALGSCMSPGTSWMNN